MRKYVLSVAGLLAACGVDRAAPPVESRQSAIIGGTSDTADDNVFMLFIYGLNNQGQVVTGAGCSATLIGSVTLLTAAHCVDYQTLNQPPSGVTSIAIQATHLANANYAGINDVIDVVEMHYHPNWNTNTLANDIGVARLAHAPAGVTPKPWNQSSALSSNLSVRVVGYGVSASNYPTCESNNSCGDGTRRQVTLPVLQMYQDAYLFGSNSQSMCHGDSGGPSFATVGGVEKVVGVHSFTQTQNCLGYGSAGDSRTDYFAPFISQWVAQWEAPSCDLDGRCKTGCTPIDQDCACAADGVCSADCLDPAMDPDCPKDCGADGTCSQGPCPNPDPDCLADGQPCTVGLQCLGKVCTDDPQHVGQTYCSHVCTTNADCPATMECSPAYTVCIVKQLNPRQPGQTCVQGQDSCGGDLCTGPAGGITRCVTPCTSATDCPGGQSCSVSFDGHQFCLDPSQRFQNVVLPAADGMGPAGSTGCASAPGPLWLLALALVGGPLARRPRTGHDGR